MTRLTLETGIQRFLDHMRIEREAIPNTLAAYGADLGRFVESEARAITKQS